MDWYELCSEVEQTVSSSVRSKYPLHWDDENHITHSMIEGLESRFSKVTIQNPDAVLNTRWGAFKLRKPLETKFGDVAILVSIKFRDGDLLYGVTFLEAKRRFSNKPKFSSLSLTQLKRLHANAPHSMVLLYDYDYITQFIMPDPHWGRWCEFWARYTPVTNCVVVPANLAIQTKRKDARLYKLSLPFSYQLCFRYLRGLDLEFNEESVKRVTGYAEGLQRPMYLLAISVAQGEQEPEAPRVSDDYVPLKG